MKAKIFYLIYGALIAAALIGLWMPSGFRLKSGKQIHGHMAYNVTIDTGTTDSLFGKTWRK